MRLALLRHGPTEWNVQGRIQGSMDIPLSDTGLAHMAGFRLPFGSARAFTSPMLRARQTARALGLCDALPDDRLVEQHWGTWEGLTRAEIIARDGADCYVRAGANRGGHSGRRVANPTQQVLDRVAAFLRDAAKGTGDAAAVTHLGVLRAAYTLATNWAMDAPMPVELDVSRVLVLELAPDGTAKIAEMNVAFVTTT